MWRPPIFACKNATIFVKKSKAPHLNTVKSALNLGAPSQKQTENKPQKKAYTCLKAFIYGHGAYTAPTIGAA
jgi:hypothetical protein